MQAIDFAINTTALLGIVYMATEFIRFCSRHRQSPAPAQVELTTCKHCDEPAEWLDSYCQEHWEEYCAGQFWTAVDQPDEDQPLPQADDEPERPEFNHRVVPFQRRPATMPEPTDRELISFAKSIGFPGSKKWSFKRSLSAKNRTALLQLWNASEVSAS